MIDEKEIRDITEKIVDKILNNQIDTPISPITTCAETGVCVNCGNWYCVTNNKAASEQLINAGADRISTNPGIPYESQKIASMIDHTLLKAEATTMQINNLCKEAKKYEFASVCINPHYVSLCYEHLKGTKVKVCTVIGFPLGATTTQTKAFETRDVVADGAQEIDMVINIGLLKSKHYQNVEDDIRAVVEAAKGNIVKIILETALLNDEEIEKGCQLSKSAGANFVKTSTGFSKGGATVHAVELMRRTVGSSMGVKASGGIRSIDDAQAMIKAGATRIGASASVEIVQGKKSTTEY